MSVNMTSWQPEIYTHLVGVPTPGLIHVVRNAARKFCEDTQLWTLKLDRISVLADTNNYAITIPGAQSAELIAIDNVKYKQDGEDDDQFVTLDPISENQMDLEATGVNVGGGYRPTQSWVFQTSPTPSAYYMLPQDPATMYLWKTPDTASASGLLVRVFLRPLKTSTAVPDFIYTNHEAAITQGALAELFAQKAMPWYDPALAGAWAEGFATSLSNARNIKVTGLTNRPIQVRLRQFV